MSITVKYPRFNDPDKYLRCRETPKFFSKLKGVLEKRILNKLLRHLPDIRTVCDAPSGPGRLFSFWSKMGYHVYGVDISTHMTQHAGIIHQQHGLQGKVIEGDIFKLDELLPDIPELVVCIRFAYYFAKEERINLLRALSHASSRYVLIQYKTSETYRGKKNQVRQNMRTKPKKKHLLWHFVSRTEIMHDMILADLIPLKISFIGPLSDRVFVLAEKKM